MKVENVMERLKGTGLSGFELCMKPKDGSFKYPSPTMTKLANNQTVNFKLWDQKLHQLK